MAEMNCFNPSFEVSGNINFVLLGVYFDLIRKYLQGGEHFYSRNSSFISNYGEGSGGAVALVQSLNMASRTTVSRFAFPASISCVKVE